MSSEPPKSWWPLSKSSSTKDLRQKYAQDKERSKPAGKFNSLATAIGLKSKKPSNPSLAIQDPPLPMQNVPSIHPGSPVSDRTRPTSSSTRSRVDSLEPRTPVDSHRVGRQSLLTLSDTDPFAGRPMIAPAVPHLPSDLNRLSVYSNPSVTDLAQKKGDTFSHVSYASSSSNSNNHAECHPVTPPFSPQVPAEYRQVQHKHSRGSLTVKRPDMFSRQTSLRPTVTMNIGGPLLKSPSPDIDPARPRMRARGMTDTGSMPRPGFFVEEPMHVRKQMPPHLTIIPVSLPSPRVVMRQASVTRINTPPASAPPTQRLPPPPSPEPAQPRPVEEDHQDSGSSRISFSSAISLTNDMFAIGFDQEIRSSDRSIFSQHLYDDPTNYFPSKTVPSPPRTLRKSLSHQSLRKNIPPLKLPPSESYSSKSSRRQKQLHPHLPIPPLPSGTKSPSSSHPHSPDIPPLPESGNASNPIIDQRRGSASSSGRRRLFSTGNRDRDRPAVNQPMSPAEDDTFSLFSVRSDNESHLSPLKPWMGNKASSPMSYWDEGSQENDSGKSHLAQTIMSKADLAKLEETVDTTPSKHSRSRGFSVLSASTIASDFDEYIPAGLSPPPPRPSSKQLSSRIPSPSSIKSPPPRLALPMHDDDNDSLIIPLSATRTQFLARPPITTSLPPPPRKQRARLISEPELPKPANPPPPLPNLPAIKRLGSIRSNLSIEKVMHRRSLLRKSSFLEIDDDSDEAEDVNERARSSFLDLARESFDTVQTGR